MTTATATHDFLPPSPLRLAALFQRAGKTRTLGVIILLMLLTASMDWGVGTNVSMGMLYMLPLMIAAAVFRTSTIVALSVVCATLGVFFYHPNPALQTTLHFFFAFIANVCAGLFMSALIRSRDLGTRYVDQISSERARRKIAEEQLSVLAARSPAAILTLDEHGVVLAANHTADVLLAAPKDQTIVGTSIVEYLPFLTNALHIAQDKEPFDSAAQWKGKRQNGEIFLAHAWFSTYRAPEGIRLAAIVVDSSEELRDQEERQLQQASTTNRIAAAALSHEMRNCCEAMSLVYSSIEEESGLTESRRFQELGNLIGGLEKIGSMDLSATTFESLEEVQLKQVLDDLRIVIEPAWKEIDGTVRWEVPERLPVILGDRHGLLQVFLNLAKNSHRAVQCCLHRELVIRVSETKQGMVVDFQDSGVGVSEPSCLFQPFQSGAGSTGMGLYVSRAILRSYGGDLKYYPRQGGGARFVVELSR